ncbi:MAG: hypothetical protein R8M38_01410 [Mariprofundaceae bacterium]
MIIDPLAFAQEEVVEVPVEPTTEAPAMETPPIEEATNTETSSSGGGCLVSTLTDKHLWLLPIAGLMLLGMVVIKRREEEGAV